MTIDEIADELYETKQALKAAQRHVDYFRAQATAERQRAEKAEAEVERLRAEAANAPCSGCADLQGQVEHLTRQRDEALLQAGEAEHREDELAAQVAALRDALEGCNDEDGDLQYRGAPSIAAILADTAAAAEAHDERIHEKGRRAGKAESTAYAALNNLLPGQVRRAALEEAAAICREWADRAQEQPDLQDQSVRWMAAQIEKDIRARIDAPRNVVDLNGWTQTPAEASKED